MGKNKGNKGPGHKGKKEKPIIVSGVKKTKTKPVASNLKKLNLQTRAKTEKADEVFKSVREAVVTSSKKKKQSTSQKAKQVVTAGASQEVDMEAAANDFAKL